MFLLWSLWLSYQKRIILMTIINTVTEFYFIVWFSYNLNIAHSQTGKNELWIEFAN